MIKQERGRARNRSRSRSNDRERSRSRGRDRSRDRPANARVAEKRVYISNIPYDVRWQDLKDLFRKEIGEVAYVELFTDESDKPRGCGIIEFENNVLAKKAIEKMHRHELSGRKIVVKEDYDVERDKTGRIVTTPSTARRDNRDRSPIRLRERDWDHRRESLSPNSSAGWKYGNTYGLSQQFLESLGVEGPLVSRVFVSNLEFRVDDKKLREVFRLAGKVLNVDVNKDKDGKSRGHGTIEFEHPVEAIQAISMFNNQELYERRLHVRMDRLSDPLDELIKGRYPDGLKGIGMGLGLNGQPLVDVSRTLSSNNNTVSNVTAVLGSGLGGTATSLTNAVTNANALAAMNMSGMNLGLASGIMGTQGIDAMNLAGTAGANAFGMSLGGALNNAQANVNQFGGAIGTPGGNQYGGGGPAQSQFGTNSLAGNLGMAQAQANQLSMNQMLQNSGVSLGSASGPGQAAQFQNAGGATGGDYGYSTSVYSTPSANYNTAYQREKQQFGNGNGGNAVAASNTCIITNLPPNMSWQMLKSKFRECGEVLYAEMKDKNTGVVRFSNERDAERAIKVFDQSRVDGRIVDVRFL